MWFVVRSIIKNKRSNSIKIKIIYFFLILKDITQLVKLYVYSLEVTSSSPTNLRAIRGLHGR